MATSSSSKLQALQIAFNWMLPKPRPNLKEGIDNKAAANLKVAISVAYEVVCKFPKIIDSHPAFIIYNSWRHICRVLREYDMSMGDHIYRGMLFGWLNGCCNIQKPMSIHHGKTHMLSSSKKPRLGSRQQLDVSVGRLSFKIRASESRGCYWVFAYIDGYMSCSLRYYDFGSLHNVISCLEELAESGGLFCVKSCRHFYSFNELVDKLAKGHCVYPVNLPPELYLMEECESVIMEQFENSSLSVKYCENSISIVNELTDSFQSLFEVVGSMGIAGVSHLLSKKYDLHTSTILTEYTKGFWKSDEKILMALTFLVEKNCSRTFKGYIKENWQGKRYCGDVSHLLTLCGYPRLWYYDKNMPATKICQKYMLSCTYKEREHTVLLKGARKGFNYLKVKRKLTKAMLLDQEALWEADPYNYKQKPIHFDRCPLRNYELTVAKRNVFITKDRMFNALACAKVRETKLERISDKMPNMLEQSIHCEEVVGKRYSYHDALSKNLDVIAESVVLCSRARAVAPIVMESKKNCSNFRKSLDKYCREEDKEELSPDGWEKPGKRLTVRFEVGRQKLETGIGNVYSILENYEEDCENKMKELLNLPIKLSNKEIEDGVDFLRAEANFSRNRKHLEVRKKKEWMIKPEITVIQKPKFYGTGYSSQRTKHNGTWRKKCNKRAAEIMSFRKKGLVSNYEKIERHYLQFRCKRVVKLRRMKILAEARKRVKLQPLFFIMFPKLKILGKHASRGDDWSWNKPRIKYAKLEQTEELKEPVTYSDCKGSVTLDKSLATISHTGAELYMDENKVCRYYHLRGCFFRYGPAGGVNKTKGKVKQKYIKFVKMDPILAHKIFMTQWDDNGQ